MPQAPHPWRKQVEDNIFCRRRGWWYVAYSSASDDASRARWRQFFGWGPPLDTARFAEIFTATFRERSASIAKTVERSNVLLQRLRG